MFTQAWHEIVCWFKGHTIELWSRVTKEGKMEVYGWCKRCWKEIK